MEHIMHSFSKAGLRIFGITLVLWAWGTGSGLASDADALGTVDSGTQRAVRPDAPPRDSRATTVHWQKARAYQGAGRYELARQEYLLSLAHCRTDTTRDRLQRELQIIEMQLRTMR